MEFNIWDEIGITEDDTVDEDDMEGEWEYVRKLRPSDGRKEETSRTDY